MSLIDFFRQQTLAVVPREIDEAHFLAMANVESYVLKYVSELWQKIQWKDIQVLVEYMHYIAGERAIFHQDTDI